MDWPKLIDAAIEARTKAFAPYSKFLVGAALLAEDGSIVTGCNVESASYGLTICAERVALFKGISDGKRPLHTSCRGDGCGRVDPTVWRVSATALGVRT